MTDFKDTYTITFGGQVENHVGMEKIGEMEKEGFSIQDLEDAKFEFEGEGCECKLVDLREALDGEIEASPAAILIIREGAKLFCDPDELYEEQKSLKWDKKAKQRGKVVNKHARWNLCYANFDQEPDYEEGKGRVVNFNNMPLLKEVRDYLPSYVGKKGVRLFAEGNYYYDPKECGIGFHGDSERKIVLAIRLGASYSLQYQWYHQESKNESVKPVGKRVNLTLNHGDMYIMSEKATGFDWKKKLVPTLRHAAGSDKFLYPKVKGEKGVKKPELLEIE